MGQMLVEREAALREVLEWEAGLQALHAHIALRFSRSESRQRVLAYLQGLLGSVERKNGWQLAEYAGDATPDGVQRLLAVYHWDADQVRDDLQGYVMKHLGDPGGVLVVDETGFLKQGQKSVGVKRQYSGTAGKVENCQIGVFLAYGSRRGAAFLDRELYLPQEWAADGVRRQEAGVPEGVAFRTKAQLAQEMIGRAVAAGVPFAWVTGDTVYGNDRRLRRWLEEQGRCYVLAVKNNEPLWADTERGSAQVAARRLAEEIPDDEWQRLSAGDGSKGPRLYDWGWLPIRPWSEPGRGHWLLVRRSIADPEDLAYYACFGTGDVSLAELVRVAGTRWIIEDAFKEANNCSDLRGSEQLAAGGEGVQASCAPGAEDGCQRHLALGTTFRPGAPADLAADNQMAQAALGGVVVRRHVRFGHEDEEFLDVALDAPAQPALQS